MEVKLDDLKIVVVPAFNCDDINPTSSVDEILKCEDSVFYTISEFFQAQNEDDFIDVWTFLIDLKNKRNYTGVDLT